MKKTQVDKAMNPLKIMQEINQMNIRA